jgi:hypothetical protein
VSPEKIRVFATPAPERECCLWPLLTASVRESD